MCKKQLEHSNKILRQLNNKAFGKVAIFDDGDEIPVVGVLSSGRLLIYSGKDTSSYDLSRIKYIKF